MSIQCINYKGKLLSPFHSCQQVHPTLWKTALHMQGSMIRGAVLGYLIRKHCPQESFSYLIKLNSNKDVKEFHQGCPESDCPAKFFFQEDAHYIFSQVSFQDPEVHVTCKVPLSKDNKSTVYGHMVSFEFIPPDTPFEGHIILFGPLKVLRAEIREAMDWVGDNEGIGHHKSIGYGRFEISENTVESEIKLPSPPKEKDGVYWWRSTSPFILNVERPDKEMKVSLNFGDLIDERIEELVGLGFMATNGYVKLNQERITFVYNPEVVKRISFESGQYWLKMTGGVDSVLKLPGDALDNDTLELVNKVLYLGIGPWRECGFGRFEAYASD